MGARSVGPALTLAARAVALQIEWRMPGNHLLEDGIGLACAGVVAEGREAEMWYRLGAAIVDRQLKAQMLADGGHFERSATYHGWILVALLELAALHEAAGRPFPDAWGRAVQRGLAFLARITAPDDSLPLFNDAALDACPAPSEIASLGAALGMAEPAHPARDGLDVVAPTGWVVARLGVGVVMADCGEVGAEYVAGHAHADSLTFELWAGGQRLVVDPGVPTYGAGAERSWSRSTAAHNTVAVDGADSSEMWGGFGVGRRARAVILDAEDRGEALSWAAQHDGYAHLPGRVIHRRRWTLRRGELTIEDNVLGEGEHTVSIGLRFDAAAFASLAPSVTSELGPVATQSSFWYARHGERRPAVTATASCRARLPFRHVFRLRFA
ncbi:alginate lyase family protein [Sorangium sp. So ce375]|uniref:heparinase II/III domain-containing protein n=1 Tax=Sorangium sp. So ce375 TaxID=3133306 RepID=UPI003F5C4760